MDNILEKSILILKRTPKVLQAMLEDICEDLVHTNEGDHTWSVWEVTAHLLYMDKTNWLDKVQTILGDGKSKVFKNYDRKAQFTNVRGLTIQAILQEFAQQRQTNLDFLSRLSLDNELLNDKTGCHPEFGAVSLAEVLTTWTAHDLTHTQQIARIMAKVYKDKVVLALLD
jgi:hypothetical protein